MTKHGHCWDGDLTTRCPQHLAKMEEQLYRIGSCSIRRVSDRDDARSGADAPSETRPKQPDRLDLRMAGGFLRRSRTFHSRSLPADLSSLWNSGFPELAGLGGTYLRPTSSLARLWGEAAPNRCLLGETQHLLATLRQECCLVIGGQAECWILLMAGGFPHRPGTSTCRSLLDDLSTSALKGVGGWDTLITHFVFSHNELSSSDCCQITASPLRWNSEFPELTVLGGTYLLCLSLECCTLMAGGFPRSTWASNSRSPLDGHSTSELKGVDGWDTLILHCFFGNNWLFLSERCLIIATVSLRNSEFPELTVLGGTYLPYVSPQAKLWVEAAHNRRLHGGTQLPLATLRQERWILSGLQVVKACIDRCTVWLLLKGQTAQPTIERVPISSNHVSAYRSGDYYDAPTHLRSRQDRGQLNSRESNSWNSNLPSSPHFGEIFKAAVNSARHHLRRIIGEQLRSFEELTTLLTGIGACCLSKLLPTLTDPEDPAALTPGHISIGEPFTAISEPSLDEPPGSRSYPLYLVLVAAVRPLASALSLPVHQLTPRLAPEDEEKDPGGTSEAGLTRGSPDASL